ncbi:hypothetical protein [Psychromonas sp. MB-3u-54]|uniref:hypothetical protein n=1 Tax=Psychromonas sp. MB-3u-54 TaxID=2058319 RepID=UPI0018E2D2FF|nr:hypothetical protein [Psychromonas sp. MB-3u-54]
MAASTENKDLILANIYEDVPIISARSAIEDILTCLIAFHYPDTAGLSVVDPNNFLQGYVCQFALAMGYHSETEDYNYGLPKARLAANDVLTTL